MGLLDQLIGQLDGAPTERIGRQLGVDGSTASKAIAQALPTLLGGMIHNSETKGAGGLAAALDRDHDGSILDDLAGYLGRDAGTGDGEGILGHVFGEAEPRVAESLGKSSGLDAPSAGKLLAMLAPIVMGALGREKRRSQLDSGGLGDLLGSERRSLGASGSGIADMLGKMLDADGDGSVTDELGEMGKNVLGSLFGDR